MQTRIVGLWVFLAVGLIRPGFLTAQDPLLLVPKDTTTVEGSVGMAGGFDGNMPCDSAGNLYLLGHGSNQVWKISSSGRVVTRFDLAKIPNPDIKSAGIHSFAVDEGGNVFLPVTTGYSWPGARVEPKPHPVVHEAYVVKFDDDGQYEDTIKLDITGLTAHQIAVFPSGEFLVNGYVTTGEGRARLVEPHVAIFERQGKQLKELKLRGDVSGENAKDQASGASRPEGVNRNSAVEDALTMGGVEVGSDGNIYIIRNAHFPIVYVLTSHGKLVRRMVLHPPAPDVYPLEESLSGGRLMVAYGNLPDSARGQMGYDQFYSVYDTLTGDHLYDYKPSPEIKGVLACYTQNAFIFLGGTETGALKLVRAEP